MANSKQTYPPRQRVRLFYPSEPPIIDYPIQSVEIDWNRLIEQRPQLLKTIENMPFYLLKPEVLTLLDTEKNPTYRLILDLMWSTGAKISEILRLTPQSFTDKGHKYEVSLSNLVHTIGRPSNYDKKLHPKRYVQIFDPQLIDEIKTYMCAHHLKPGDRLFPMVRQTVNRHIHALVELVGGAPMAITSHTFRDSFAIHLILHGRPPKNVSRLLGHNTTERAELLTNVLTVDEGHLLHGVNFH